MTDVVTLGAGNLPPQGKLPQNILYFCRALRRAGVQVGPAQAIDAIRAVEAAGFTRRMDFFLALRACLITKASQLDVFERIFTMFWRDPEFLENMMAMMLPVMQKGGVREDPKSAETRALDAMLDEQEYIGPEREAGEELVVDAQFSFSSSEKLSQMDFEQMTNAEMADAKRALARLELPVKPIKSRRLSANPAGKRIDARATLKKAMRNGGEIIRLPKQAPRERFPDLVALCDISGSMSVYSRMFMHFLHSLQRAKGAGWARVHGFTFSTRLTNITRNLSLRDPDAALKAVGQQAGDWDGGTRIGACLEEFNKVWSRRVLARGAVVLLITDGLERADVDNLRRQGERLHLSARQVIWLNPLMRWDGFSPQAAGIRALLPLVDSFHSCHNLSSLGALAQVLSNPNAGEKTRMMALL